MDGKRHPPQPATRSGLPWGGAGTTAERKPTPALTMPPRARSNGAQRHKQTHPQQPKTRALVFGEEGKQKGWGPSAVWAWSVSSKWENPTGSIIGRSISRNGAEKPHEPWQLWQGCAGRQHSLGRGRRGPGCSNRAHHQGASSKSKMHGLESKSVVRHLKEGCASAGVCGEGKGEAPPLRSGRGGAKQAPLPSGRDPTPARARLPFRDRLPAWRPRRRSCPLPCCHRRRDC